MKRKIYLQKNQQTLGKMEATKKRKGMKNNTIQIQEDGGRIRAAGHTNYCFG